MQLFRRLAWANLVYNLAVILWGAYVRATGSGAGCGEHWPLCNGVVVPRAESIEMAIEFTHRVTSGLALVFAVALFVLARMALPVEHAARRAAKVTVFLMIVEALLGAGLVLFRLVAHDDSVARAVAMALHLSNTLFLLASMTLTAHFASGHAPVRVRGQGAVGAILVAGIAMVVVLGASGAVTALGDTLFPAASLDEIGKAVSPTAHFLQKLRFYHPLLAMVTGIYLVLAPAVAAILRPSARRAAIVLPVLFGAQIGCGIANLVLMAPVWMQLAHLLLADLVWISLVRLAAVALAEGAPRLAWSRRQLAG